MGDRETMETGEARTLVHGFIHNNESKEWLVNALRFSKRIYGKDSEKRIREHMKTIWKLELCKGRIDTQAGEVAGLGLEGVSRG